MSDLEADVQKAEATAQADVAVAKSWFETIPWRWVAGAFTVGVVLTLILRH